MSLTAKVLDAATLAITGESPQVRIDKLQGDKVRLQREVASLKAAMRGCPECTASANPSESLPRYVEAAAQTSPLCNGESTSILSPPPHMTGSASPYELEQPIPVIPLPSDVTHPSLSWAPVPRLYNATGKPPIFPMTSSRYLIESRTPASNSSTGLPPVVATETYTSQPSSVSTSDITPPSNQVDSTPPSTPEGPTESWAGGTQAISDFHPTNPSLPVTLTAVELAETLTSMAHVASPSSDRQTGSVSKRCTTALQNPSLVLAPIRSSESSVGPFSTSNVGSVSSVGSTSIGPTLIPLDPSLSITPTTPTKNLHNEAVFPASHSASASDMTLEPSSSAFSWTSINFDEFPEMNPRVSTATGSHPPVADLERQTNMKRKRTISGHDSSSSVKPKKGKFNRLMNEFKTKVTEKQGSPHMSQERRIAMRRKTLHSTPNWLSLKNNLKSIFVPPHFPTVLPLSLLIKLLGTEVLGFLNAFRFASHSADPRHPNRLHQALRKSSPKGFIFLHTAPGVPSRPGQAVLLLSVRSQAHCGSISPVLGRGGEDGVVYFGHYLPQWKRHLEAGEFERLGRDHQVSLAKSALASDVSLHTPSNIEIVITQFAKGNRWVAVIVLNPKRFDQEFQKNLVACLKAENQLDNGD